MSQVFSVNTVVINGLGDMHQTLTNSNYLFTVCVCSIRSHCNVIIIVHACGYQFNFAWEITSDSTRSEK